ncbi:SH3 domain-containing protein [Oceanomicrobium pacificus]|uniref:SH3 domain-containing protein n=1 Tax=Oceanomicrobium pacificus TaxID=2692916 RepID=A0A6B0TTP8_9RHOB|nr:SH3 domain-containing protein [Oceanomicrobium pacificus]MXU65175.1 hypothetical protein [Oceanomicrobium pacificus]
MRAAHAVAWAAVALASGTVGGAASAQDRPDLDGAAYAAITGVEKRLNMRAGASTSTDVAARLPLGTVVRLGDCAAAEGRVWCGVSLMDGTDRQGFAAAEFLSPAHAWQRAAAGIYDEIGALNCAGEDGAALRCAYGLARDADGAAVLRVEDAAGAPRMFLFRDGAVSVTPQALSEGGLSVSAGQGGQQVAHYGTRFAIPDRLVAGE